MGPGGGGGGGGGLTSAQQDAIGYVGGGILAICLIPQVAKVVVTRSARDISISWSVLYSIGLTLSLAYLILKDAPAAWIPIIFEIAGCLLVLFLKLFYEHTGFGRNFSAAKQQQQLVLPLHDTPDSRAAAADRHGIGHSLSGLVTAASGDISWRGRAVLGQHQEAPSPLTVPMIDVSVHGGSRYGGSRHGSMRGSRQNSLSLSPRAMQAGKQQPHQEQQELACKALQAGDSRCGGGMDGVLEVKCMGTSVYSFCSSSSIPAVQEGPRAVSQPADVPHQQQQPREPLFASTLGLQAGAPEAAGAPAAAAASSRQHHHQQ